MGTRLVKRASGKLLTRLPRETRIQRCLEILFSDKSEKTVEAYRQDLSRFGVWLGEPDTTKVTIQLFAFDSGTLNATVADYKKAQVAAKLASATINRGLVVLRTLVKLGRMLEVVPANYFLEVKNLKKKPVKNSKGPKIDKVRQLLEEARELAATGLAFHVRNYALLRLLTDLGLRQGAIRSMRYEHVTLSEGGLHLRMKGHDDNDRAPFVMPPLTQAAFTAWLDLRGDEPGPVFFSLRRKERKPLTSKGFWKIVHTLTKRHPHAFRHTAITEVLKKEGIRAAMHFARHIEPRTTMGYDDSRQETGDAAARTLVDLYEKKD